MSNKMYLLMSQQFGTNSSIFLHIL